MIAPFFFLAVAAFRFGDCRFSIWRLPLFFLAIAPFSFWRLRLFYLAIAVCSDWLLPLLIFGSGFV
jgi:hypothetical protein